MPDTELKNLKHSKQGGGQNNLLHEVKYFRVKELVQK